MSGDYIECPKCGFRSPSNAKYCANCGAKLAASVKGYEVGVHVYTLIGLASLIGLLDVLLNAGIRALMANQMFLMLSSILAISSAILMIMTGYSVALGRGFNRHNLIITVLLLMLLAGSLTYYFLFFIAGSLIVSPTWILYLYLLFLLKRYVGARGPAR